MKQSIKKTITEEMNEKGYQLIGVTSGWFTTRRGSNLEKKLKQLGVFETYMIEEKEIADGLRYADEATFIIRCGARKQRRTEGTDIFIYQKS